MTPSLSDPLAEILHHPRLKYSPTIQQPRLMAGQHWKKRDRDYVVAEYTRGS